VAKHKKLATSDSRSYPIPFPVPTIEK